MNIVVITPEIVFRLTARAEVYAAAPYLTPMRNAALGGHKKMPKKNCSSCAKRAKIRFSRQLCGAFTRLTKDHYRAGGGQLSKLKAVMSAILNLKIDEVQLGYQEDNGDKGTIKF